ncbi:MAG: hypothetical protein AAFY99_11345 [Pseudomonadota bacterium]
MSDDLTEDQKKRIEATLKRIQAGLSRADIKQLDEPAHIFDPEAQSVARK